MSERPISTVEVRTTYEVVMRGECFSFDTMREMATFARSLDRRYMAVRCQVRCGANVAAFKREAWLPIEEES